MASRKRHRDFEKIMLENEEEAVCYYDITPTELWRKIRRRYPKCSHTPLCVVKNAMTVLYEHEECRW